MNIEGVEKKLREAQFFLNKMIEHERKAFEDKEPFEFYLSAFLSAGRSVGYYVRHQQKAKGWSDEARLKWRKDCEAALPQPQQTLIKYMVDTRDVEVHEGPSRHTVRTENRELGLGVHKLASGTMEVFGPPDVSPAAVIHVPAYYFTIDGIERKVTDACSEYLALLERMSSGWR